MEDLISKLNTERYKGAKIWLGTQVGMNNRNTCARAIVEKLKEDYNQPLIAWALDITKSCHKEYNTWFYSIWTAVEVIK